MRTTHDHHATILLNFTHDRVKEIIQLVKIARFSKACSIKDYRIKLFIHVWIYFYANHFNVCFFRSIDNKRSSGRSSRRSEEHTSELQSRPHLVCRLLLEKKKKKIKNYD